MSDKQTGMVRSDFLVYWTGKKIHRCHETIRPEHRREYLERLLDILREGLWMRRSREKICVPMVPQTGGAFLGHEWPITCFTEIKLSQVHRHTKRYGCLGFGFSREFVIRRFGAPVQYVAETDRDIISYHSYKLFEVLRFLNRLVRSEMQDPGTNFTLKDYLEASPLSSFLKELGYDKNAETPWGIFEALGSSIATNILFLKKMSECRDPHDFQNLDESEWRIPMIRSGLPPDVDPPVKRLTDEEKDRYRDKYGDTPEALIQFGQADLKILILPDDETRKEALKCQDIKNWLFKEPGKLPIITTVKECLQF